MKHSALSTALAVLLALLMLLSLVGCAGITQLISPTPSPSPTPTATPAPTPEPMPTPSPSPAPDINSFRVGFGDETGYISRYFNFGVRIPYGWYYDDRDAIDEENKIQANRSDKEAYFQEYIDRLKSGEVLYDYFAYNIETSEMLFVYLQDNSSFDEDILSEKEVLDYFADKAFDLDADGIAEATHLQSDTFELNNIKHGVYFYQMPYKGEINQCAILVIPQSTTYAIIIVDCLDQQTAKDIVYSIYPLFD